MPLFGPPLPLNPAFANHEEFREFLLVKCKYAVVKCQLEVAKSVPTFTKYEFLCSSSH